MINKIYHYIIVVKLGVHLYSNFHLTFVQHSGKDVRYDLAVPPQS